MGSNYDNLRNKTAKVYLSTTADNHLELILDKNFVEHGKRFNDCVQWYRLLIYYLNELAGLKDDAHIVNSNGLLQANCGELGTLTYYLYLDSNEKLNVLIVDFNFNQYKSLIIEKRKNLIDMITEAVINQIKKQTYIIYN